MAPLLKDTVAGSFFEDFEKNLQDDSPHLPEVPSPASQIRFLKHLQIPGALWRLPAPPAESNLCGDRAKTLCGQLQIGPAEYSER
jgi:hypothetical protein